MRLRFQLQANKGFLVCDGVCAAGLQARLGCDDAQAHGWLLDGYPRSAEQAEAIEEAGIRPDIFILIEARPLRA